MIRCVSRRGFCGVLGTSPGRLSFPCKAWKTALSPQGERAWEEYRGSLGHLFRFDWWVFGRRKGNICGVASAKRSNATAALVGPIVLSAKNSNHFKPKCWCRVPSSPLLPPPPLPHSHCADCVRRRPSGLVSAWRLRTCSVFFLLQVEGSQGFQQNPSASIQQRRRRTNGGGKTNKSWFQPALVKHWP